MEEVYNIFNSELKMVNKEMNQRKDRFPDYVPHLAGQAHWARALRNHIDKSVEVNLLDDTIIDMYSLK